MDNLIRNLSTFGFFRFIDFFQGYNKIYIYICIFLKNFTIYIVIYAVITFEKIEKSKKPNVDLLGKLHRWDILNLKKFWSSLDIEKFCQKTSIWLRHGLKNCIIRKKMIFYKIGSRNFTIDFPESDIFTFQWIPVMISEETNVKAVFNCCFQQ